MHSLLSRFLLGVPLVASALALLTAPLARGQEYDQDVAKLRLDQLPVPEPANLADFVADRQAAIALGKALFWDMQVGSDQRMACASCHYNAGADSRSRAQLNPGLLLTDVAGQPAADRTFQTGDAHAQLKPADFPLRQLVNPDDRDSAVLRDSNDVVGSQGVQRSLFGGLAVVGAGFAEQSTPAADSIFASAGHNLRRVSPRNAPSVINAVFNRRNFWDGRAQDLFNGVNASGLRDPDALVWIAPTATTLKSVSIQLSHSSLASQAVGPVLSSFEMAAAGRSLVHVAKRLLLTRPLALQTVHVEDSVLGRYVPKSGPGLTVATYGEMIRAAFKQQWWQSTQLITAPTARATAESTKRKIAAANNGLLNLDNEDALELLTISDGQVTQMQANFALFFGLALQMYQSTLVSDEAPIDRFAAGDATALTPLQKQGLDLFLKKANCAGCHSGPAFTAAAPGLDGAETRIELMMLGPGRAGIYDAGFYNIGVRPAREDLGLGALDALDLPLAEAKLVTLGQDTRAALTGTNEFFYQFPTDLPLGAGFFKTPSLRNVELTAPYFHNGGQATLEQVVDFYNRGGDFLELGHNEAVRPLKLTAEEKGALVAFLRSLTDDRVRYRRAPFDHPSLVIPNGRETDRDGVPTGRERFITLPAVGKNGGTPLPGFLQ